MSILITGATGYIGSAVVRELVNAGEGVRCLVRKTSNMKNLGDLHVELAYGDIRDIDSVRRALQGCNSVYHLAAIYANWLPDPGLMYQVNEEGTRNVLTACKDAGVQKIVYCSSVAALGNRNVTMKEYFDLIVNVAGRGRSPFVKLPRWVAVFSGYGYQMLARINGKPPVTSASWARVGSHYSWWDCTMAREQLGLGQRPLEKSIADAVEWFQANGYI